MNTTVPNLNTFDFRQALNENRLIGVWRMMTDFRMPYLGATAALADLGLCQDLHLSFARLFRR